MAGGYYSDEAQGGGYYGELNQTLAPTAREQVDEALSGLGSLAGRRPLPPAGLPAGPSGTGVGGTSGGMPSEQPYAPPGGTPVAPPPDATPPPRDDLAAAEDPGADPVPAYLTRQGQQALRGGARPAVGGVAGYRPIESTSLSYFDDRIAKAKQEEAARFRRIMEDPTLSAQQKARLAAEGQQMLRKQVADIQSEKAAHLETVPGKMEQRDRIATEGQVSAIEDQAADTQMVAEGQADRASMMRQESREQRDLYQGHREAQQRRQQAVEQAQDEWMSGMQEWRQAAKRAESENPLSTGQSIFGVLGLTLAAIATGIDGKDHVGRVTSTLEKTIEREIKKKQQALNNKRQGVMDQQNVVGVMQNRFQDAEMAYQASKAAMAEEFKREMMASRETTLAQRNLAKYDQAIEAVDRVERDAKLAMEIRADQRAAAENLMRQRAAAAAAQRRREAEMRAQGIRKLKGKENFLYDPGTGQVVGMFPGDVDDKRADEVRNQYADVAGRVQVADRLVQIADKGTTLSPDDVYEFRQWFQTLRTPLKKDIAGAAENEQEAKAIDALIVGGESFDARVLGQAAPALRRFQAAQNDALKKTFNANGIMPGRRLPSADGDEYFVPGQTSGGAQLRDAP